MSDRIVRILRAQAWERAKGELMGMLHTFYTVDGDEGYELFEATMKEFIRTIEYCGLHQ